MAKSGARTGLRRFGPGFGLYLAALIGEKQLGSPQWAWLWDWLPWFAALWTLLAAVSYSDSAWDRLFGWWPVLQRPKGRRLAAVPRMTLEESFREFIPARDRGLSALSVINGSMADWNRRTDEIKAQAKATGQSRDGYWTDQAAAMDVYANTLERGCRMLAESTETLLYVVDARVFWHDKKNAAADLLTDDCQEVFTAMRKVCVDNSDKLRRNQQLLDGYVMSHHQLMDVAAVRWRGAADVLILQYSVMASLSREILKFRRYRVGVLGFLRSMAVKARRLVARNRLTE